MVALRRTFCVLVGAGIAWQVMIFVGYVVLTVRVDGNRLDRVGMGSERQGKSGDKRHRDARFL